MTNKYNRIILFDMPGKDYIPSYGALQIVSQLASKGYEVEYCDLDEESFQLFEDKEVFYETLERFEKVIATNRLSTKKRAVAFCITKYLKSVYNKNTTIITFLITNSVYFSLSLLVEKMSTQN